MMVNAYENINMLIISNLTKITDDRHCELKMITTRAENTDEPRNRKDNKPLTILLERKKIL